MPWVFETAVQSFLHSCSSCIAIDGYSFEQFLYIFIKRAFLMNKGIPLLLVASVLQCYICIPF